MKLVFRKQIQWNDSLMGKFFEGHCCQWEYRGPTIEKNYNLGEIIFFTDFCFPQIKLICLVSFINGVHKFDAINKNRSLEKLFFQENVFLLNRFEWRSFKWRGRGGGGGGVGVLKTDDRSEKVYFWELFHRKSIHINVFFGLVWFIIGVTHKWWWK